MYYYRNLLSSLKQWNEAQPCAKTYQVTNFTNYYPDDMPESHAVNQLEALSVICPNFYMYRVGKKAICACDVTKAYHA